MFVHIAQEKTVNAIKVVKDFKDLKDFVFRFRLLRRNRTKKTAFFARISLFSCGKITNSLP